jgi:hypothetical protein
VLQLRKQGRGPDPEGPIFARGEKLALKIEVLYVVEYPSHLAAVRVLKILRRIFAKR